MNTEQSVVVAIENCTILFNLARLLSLKNTPARVVKLVDAPDSKSGLERGVGSSPTLGTKLKKVYRGVAKLA